MSACSHSSPYCFASPQSRWHLYDPQTTLSFDEDPIEGTTPTALDAASKGLYVVNGELRAVLPYPNPLTRPVPRPPAGFVYDLLRERVMVRRDFAAEEDELPSRPTEALLAVDVPRRLAEPRDVAFGEDALLVWREPGSALAGIASLPTTSIRKKRRATRPIGVTTGCE